MPIQKAAVKVSIPGPIARTVLGVYYADQRLPEGLHDSVTLNGRDRLVLDATLDRPSLTLGRDGERRLRLHLTLIGTLKVEGDRPLDARRVLLRFDAVCPVVCKVLEDAVTGAPRSAQIAIDGRAARVEGLTIKAPGTHIPSWLGQLLRGEAMLGWLQGWLRGAAIEPWPITHELFDGFAARFADLASMIRFSVEPSGFLLVGLVVPGVAPCEPLAALDGMFPAILGSAEQGMLIRTSGDLMQKALEQDLPAIIARAKRQRVRLSHLEGALTQVLPAVRIRGKVDSGGADRFELTSLTVVNLQRDQVLFRVSCEVEQHWLAKVAQFFGRAVLCGMLGFAGELAWQMISTHIRAGLNDAAEGIEDIIARDGRRTHWLTLPGSTARVRISVESFGHGLAGEPDQLTRWSIGAMSAEIPGRRTISPRDLAEGYRFWMRLPRGVARPGEPGVRVRWILRRGGAVRVNRVGPLGEATMSFSHPADDGYRGEETLQVSVWRDEPDGGRTPLAQGKHKFKVGERLDQRYPYVRWRTQTRRPIFQTVATGAAHTQEEVYVGAEEIERESRIHKTDPRARCPDADQMSDNGSASVEYLSSLPSGHSSRLCQACFS